MPHVTLKDPGFKNLTGMFGRHLFENGRSIESLSDQDAALFGAIAAVTTDDGHNPSITQKAIDTRSDEAPIVDPAPAIVRDETESKDAQKQSDEATAVPAITREQLEQIADKQGLAGVREIGVEYKVADKSIPGLINKIMEIVEGK